MTIEPLSEQDFHHIWNIGFRAENPLWATYNAPYFQDYVLCPTFEAFLEEEKGMTNPDKTWGIFLDDVPIGTLGRYWENEATRWLEIGLVIYEESKWSSGYGQAACNFWIAKCFEDFLEIERVGLTTWSGNPGMMKLAENWA